MRSLPAILGALFLTVALRSPGAELAAPGFRATPLGVHALINARVFARPDTVFSNATVLLRDGLIVAVGPAVTPPPDARIWDLRGHTIYAGFVDAYLNLGATNLPLHHGPNETGVRSADTLGTLTSGANSGAPRFFGVTGQETDPGLPGPGHGLAEVHPELRSAAGYAPDPKELEALRELGFTAGHLVPSQGIFRGQSALVTLGDSGPNNAVLKPDVAQVVALAPSGREGVYPGSLMGVFAVIRQALLDARHQRESQGWLRTQTTPQPRAPFNTALDALQSTLDGQPVFIEAGGALLASRADRIGAELGLTNRVLVASGQEWRRPDLIRSDSAWVVPLGFPAVPKLPDEAAWDGISLDQLRAWDWAPENPAVLRQRGAILALTTFGLAERKDFRPHLRAALDRGWRESDALAALTTWPALLCGVSDRLGTIEPGRIANLTIVEGSYFDPAARVREVWIDGREYDFGPGPAKGKPGETKAETAADPKNEAKAAARRELARLRTARSPMAGRGVLTNPPAVYLRNATVWTSGPEGVLTNASLLAVGGRITFVGGALAPSPELPTNTLVLDLAGRHVSAGLIDAHSHSMILGSVNEGTLPSTAMCRIADVVNSETACLNQQLAGGLTVANQLHGSANPIGGQNCVIKLRDGAGPDELVFSAAPAGIKFALGENVKQSNWGEKFTTRFPQSRMGVPVFYLNRFEAARQYVAARALAAAGSAAPVRRDLELDALAEILAGTRLIHCHSYRQDEILVFLRTMESLGVRVATLQHILEGYKVADEIARHGAGASAFADWWAYKFEVLDAIPYGGSLMRDRGVLVSFNSDSNDHARRLNFEAAKAVKYGGVPEAEALKFVTINPARQLRIDARVGSLEPGKDADFVIWSGPPLDSGSRCLETWIEGRKYFDLGLEAVHVTARRAERAALIAKAKKLTGDGGDAGPSDKARGEFFRTAWENARRLGVSACQDCQFPQRP